MNNKLTIVQILAFPIVLTMGILLIPVVTDYANHQLAEQAVAQNGRWYVGHILAAVGFALSILAISLIDRYLRTTSRALPGVALPLITIGAGLYAAGLGADGVGPVAVQTSGNSPVLFFDGSTYLVTGLFVAGTVIFGVGLLFTVIGAIRLELLQGWSRQISFISALVFMVAPTVLSGYALYGVAVASFGIFIPFAIAIHRNQ